MISNDIIDEIINDENRKIITGIKIRKYVNHKNKKILNIRGLPGLPRKVSSKQNLA